MHSSSTGSWNRLPRSRYKVIFIPFTHGRPNGATEDVLTGFVKTRERRWGGLWTAVGRPEFRRARERALSFCGPARGLRRRRSLFRDDALASRRTATLACGYRTAYHARRPLTSPSAQAHDFEMGGIVRGPLAHAISIADQDIISFPSSRCGFDSHCPLPIASKSQDQPKIQLFSDRPRSSAS